MADPFVLANIRRVPLFERLTPDQLEWIASATQPFRYEPGETVFQQGLVPPGLFMFVSGSGMLTEIGADRIERSLGPVTAGEYLPDEALFTEAPARFNLRVTETSIVLFLSRQQMLSILAYRPDIKNNLVFRQPNTPNMPAPQAQSFEEQRANEQVVLETRRHLWSFAGRSVGLLIVILLIWVISASLSPLVPLFPTAVVTLPISGLLLLLILYYYLEWKDDKLIITDRRLINTRRMILNFSKEVNEIPLDKVLEVNVNLPPLTDVIGRMLGYGTLAIKTSGNTPNINLYEIPQPQSIQQMIFNQRKKFQELVENENRDAFRKAIRNEIDQLTGTGEPTNRGLADAKGSITRNPGLFSIEYVNNKGEVVYRKHWLVWIGHVLLPTLVILAGITLFLLNVIFPLVPLGIVVLGMIWFYLADWDWRNDMYIIGEQTITIIHKRPLFLEDQKDQFSLAQIDNVVSDTTGLTNSLFQIGQVKIRLVGGDEKNAKRFTSVFSPRQIQEEISRRQENLARAKRDGEFQRQRDVIREYLDVYHQATGQPPPPGTPFPNPQTSPAGIPVAPQYSVPPGIGSNYVPPSVPASGFIPPLPPENPNIEPPVMPPTRDGSRPPTVPRVRNDRNPPPA